MHMAMVMGASVLLLVMLGLFGSFWGAGMAGVAMAAKRFVPARSWIAPLHRWAAVALALWPVSRH